MSSIFVARQPIFELGKGLYGYELLYRRDASTESADGEDGYMSADVIVGSLLGIGLPAISGDGVAFINFSRGQLRNQSWELFEPASVIIELLETVECDIDTIAACRKMVKAGYRLALDDYVYQEESAPLLELASIAKVDVLGRPHTELIEISKQLAPTGVRLLAERVETATVRDMCTDIGFELFQGYLFSRPEMLTKTDVSPSQLSVMRLLNLLQDPNTSDAALDAVFQSDVALCYKLLRIVNAASLGGRGITSIPHAVRMVGREMLHRWLAVILVASLGRKGDVTHELALTAITRARMCELLAAGNSDRRFADSAFIVGLLSLLDVLLEIPMAKILARLELNSDVVRALLERSGPFGAPLKLVESYERAEWESAQAFATQTTTAEETLPDLYLDALQWAALRLTMT